MRRPTTPRLRPIVSLRARVLGLVLLATLLPALLLGWRFFRDSDAEALAAVKTLAALADNVATELDHRVQGTSQLHFGLAHSRVLDTADREECSRYLSDVREAYPQYTGILTVLPDGQLFCDSLQTGRVLNLADRGYFQHAQAGAAGVILEPVFGRLTGNAVLQIVYPARTDAGVLRFLLVASLNLQQFARLAREQLLREGVELVLVDRKGVVMAWDGAGSGGPKAGSSIADSALFALAQARPDGGVGELRDERGESRVWAVAASPAAAAAGLHVLVGLPQQSLMAAAKRNLRSGLSVLAAAALMLFAGMGLLYEWGIRRQVGRITTMVRTLGDGDLGARIAAPYPRGELGGLMGALNSTADSLQQQRAAIDELGERLRLSQKLEAMGTLAGGIAHDFNNIIGAILGNLSLAQADLEARRAPNESLSQIRRAALRARSLVQRIRAFSRADAPALTTQPLRPIVEEVLALVQVALPAGVTLNAAIDELPGDVAADATQLHQVLLNLCSNAWQALKGEPGTVTLKVRSVQLGTDAATRPAGLGAGPHALITVNDTGCGIDADMRKRIFEPYFTTRAGEGGTGLGLSAAHGIVGAHNGSIGVESEPGKGSTFSVWLPLLPRQVLAAAAPAPGPDVPRDVAATGQRVLYIDDDEVICVMVQRLLERDGYNTTCRLSAQDALAMLRIDPLAFDVVVTDYNMPEMSGLDVSREVRRMRAGMPIVIVSGYVPDDLPVNARNAGVHAVVGKEQVTEDLVPAIAGALAQAAVWSAPGGMVSEPAAEAEART